MVGKLEKYLRTTVFVRHVDHSYFHYAVDFLAFHSVFMSPSDVQRNKEWKDAIR